LQKDTLSFGSKGEGKRWKRRGEVIPTSLNYGSCEGRQGGLFVRILEKERERMPATRKGTNGKVKIKSIPGYAARQNRRG